MAGALTRRLGLNASASFAAGYSNKWRLYNNSTQTAGNTTIVSELEWRASVGGSSQLTGGTASASSQGGSQAASLAFDGSATTFWSSSASQSPIIPTWLEYDPASVITGDELVIAGSTSAEANNPKSIQWERWDGAAWQPFITCTDIGLFGKGGTKYLRKTANQIWLKELLSTHTGPNTSYTDNRATMAIRVLPSSNVVIEAVTAWHRSAVGGQYQAIVYELNSSNQFVAETAAGTISSAAASATVADRVYPFSSPVTLVSGTKYAIGIRRVDGTNTSNPDCHFANVVNSFQTAPMTIQDIYTVANKAAPAVGTASTITNGSAIVWTISCVYRQQSGTLT